MSAGNELEGLRSQVQALTEQVQELQRKMQPAPAVRAEPVRPLPAVGATERIAMANMRMSAEVAAPMVEAFPEELARAVREDRHASAPTSMIPARENVGSPRMPLTGAVRKLRSGYQG